MVNWSYINVINQPVKQQNKALNLYMQISLFNMPYVKSTRNHRKAGDVI